MIAGTGLRIADISDVWPRYACRAKRARTDAASLQRVISRCRAGLALCLECDDGMAVVTLAGPTGEMELRVLLAVSHGGAGGFARREPELLAVAHDMRARAISFRTDRAPAWARVLGPAWRRIEDDRFWRDL